MKTFAVLVSMAALAFGDAGIMGRVQDLHGQPVAGAEVRVAGAVLHADSTGRFASEGFAAGDYVLTATAKDLRPVSVKVALRDGIMEEVRVTFTDLAAVRETVVITSTSVEPSIDRRNEEVFHRTLFTRDDQIFQQLGAGINAGQHEGGGKSLEIRRFGFNMDHGGVNGGLKVLLDGVQQNQGTQGHGQGYLGSLKTLSPELIQEVTVVNGPFSAEYGDFSGLGVVHIRQRESLPQRYTARLQGGNFRTSRGFLGFSPDVERLDAYGAYEGSYSDGPFRTPLGYRRDNVNGNFSRSLRGDRKVGVRVIGGRNNFRSSGQIPLDLVSAGTLDRFASLDDTQGGRVKLGTVSGYYSQGLRDGGTLKLDAFVSRSLFDLYSNFTYFAANPLTGDAIQQHDSRLQEGVNAQYTRPHTLFGLAANLTAGGNFHDNQIQVGLYPREGRVPTSVTARANAHVTNSAGYAQESLSLFRGHVLVVGGLRYDSFRYQLGGSPRSGAKRHSVRRAAAGEGVGVLHSVASSPAQFARQLWSWHQQRGCSRSGVPAGSAALRRD